MRLTLFLVPALLLAPQALPAAETGPTAAKPGQAQPADKLICRKRLKTGTLAQYEKSCHTRAEWEKIGDAWRDTWQDIQGAKGSTHGG